MTRLAALIGLLLTTTAAAGTPKAPPTDGCVSKALARNAVSFRTADGVRLSGLQLGSGPRGIVLAHELRASLCNWLPFARTLAGSGYRVLLFDSRNAGVSGVAPYPKSVQLQKDLLAAEKELLRRGAKRIVLGGASAGGTAAMTAAASAGPALAGVIVLSSPAQYIQMDAEAAAKRVTAPSFFAVGRGDTDFVGEMQKLYDASAAERKQLEILETGAHGTDMLKGSTTGVLRPKLVAFLAAAFAQ